jgi:hypothetical protein
MFGAESKIEDAENIDEIVARENISHFAKIVFVIAVGCAIFTGVNTWRYMTVSGELPGRIISAQTITRGYVQRGGKYPDRYYQCYMNGGEKCVAVDYRIGKLPAGTEFSVIEAWGDVYHVSDPAVGKSLSTNSFYFFVTLLIAVFSLIKWMFPRFLNLKKIISPTTTKLFDE